MMRLFSFICIPKNFRGSVIFRNFCDEVSQDLSRGACEGPKFSRIKFSRLDKNPRNPRKFSPSKILGYTVLLSFKVAMGSLTEDLH